MDNNIQLAPSEDILSNKTLKSALVPLHASEKTQLKVVTNFIVEQTHLYVIALPPHSETTQTVTIQAGNGLSSIEFAQQLKPDIQQILCRENLLHSLESPISILNCFESENRYYAVVKVVAPSTCDIASSTAAALSSYKQSFDRAALQQLLTPREQEIICLIAVGLPNKQIASRLDISVWTVSAHLRRIFIKLKVDTRAAVVYQCAKLIQSWE